MIRRILIAVLLVLLTTGCHRKLDPPVWRFAIEETSGSVQDAYAQKFKELVEEKSGGKVIVKVYPYGTLGTSDQLSELLYNGSLQFAMASPGHIGKMIPEVQVLLLHYVFSDDEEVNRKVLKSPEIKNEFNQLFADKGFEMLSVFSEGWQVWSTNKPIKSPQDFAGVKFRVMTSPLLMAAYEAYGASSTPLAYSEVYSALQLKMIDGQVNPVFAIEEMSFYEVNDHLIFANLTAEEKAWVDESIEELSDYIAETQARFNEERLHVIQEKNPDIKIVELTPQERAAFRQASVPVREQFKAIAGERGGELLETILKEVERIESEKDRKASE